MSVCSVMWRVEQLDITEIKLAIVGGNIYIIEIQTSLSHFMHNNISYKLRHSY